MGHVPIQAPKLFLKQAIRGISVWGRQSVPKAGRAAEKVRCGTPMEQSESGRGRESCDHSGAE